MTKLIGNNPNQVPSNADLGTAAFMDEKDFLTSRGSSLSAIDTVISKTATGVFIYDTSKDSDGGAWRKRTSHTSWYKERLKTTTRGSRKEFPSVVVIVCNNSTLTIYDADDVTLPMWMVFNAGSTATNETVLRFGDIKQAVALNGTLLVRLSNHYGPTALNFISEKALTYRDNGIHEFMERRGLVDRNALNAEPTNFGAPTLLSSTINDIAITVMPSAPIDDATGLPVPTMALSNALGVSVIKDDGNIFDIRSSNGWVISGFLTFDKENYINAHVGNATGQGLVFRYPVPSSDITVAGGDQFMLGGANIYNQSSPHFGSDLGGISMITHDESGVVVNTKNRGSSQITKFARNMERVVGANNYTRSAVTYINSEYNTGWMVGDIKVATLSDTSTANFVDYVGGAGDFSNASQWSPDSQWSVSGGTASYSGSGPAYITRASNGTFVYGNWYYAELDVTAGSTGSLLLVNRHISGVAKPYTNGLTNVDVGFIQLSGTKYFAMWKQNSNNQTSISLYSTSAVTVDNFKVYEISSVDRSKNNKPLIRYGTVNKTPVESGADLMAYSVPDTTSYLEQPYNADLDFGTTGDFHYSFWVYSDSNATYSGATYIFERTSVGDPSNRRIEARMDTSTNLQVYANNAVFLSGSTAITMGADSWNKVDIIRKSNEGSVWVNGVQKVSGSHSGNMTDTAAGLTVCNRGYFSPHAQGFPTGIALFRVSGTAPSDEQIKKFYEDEKFLFQENAKATFYGTSDGVLALAYDDDTELLHVGTDQGRSVFKGLRRIDNTTRAIGTAISAVDGFVVEE